MNVLQGRLAAIDTDGKICLRERDDLEVAVVKVLSHGWDSVFDMKYSVG